jgi:hypothetical protein
MRSPSSNSFSREPTASAGGTDMVAKQKGLWGLVWGQQWIDPDAFAEAIREQVLSGDLDFRTRLLIRDGMEALQGHWGKGRWEQWLGDCPVRDHIASICSEDLGEPGFTFLRSQLVEPTRPETVQQLFRELGQALHERVKVYVGGSAALIIPGYLSRQTQDVDIVDELPKEIRSQRKLLDDLQRRYRLRIAHFQSHYLPTGWQNRAHFLDSFGDLTVYLVDAVDIFLSKLFSSRTKDLDDLRALAPQLEKDTLIRRLRETTASMRAAEDLRPRAEKNWYIVYGEPLPT